MAEIKRGGLSRAAVEPWARHVLQTTAECDELGLRRAALSKLAAADWKPDLRTQTAVAATLSPVDGDVETTAAAAAAAYGEAEQFFRAHVEKFAGEFFSLSTADRRSAWERHWAKAAAFPAVQARLSSLKSGLDVELPRVSGETLQRLVELSGKWFTTRIGERAELRRAVHDLLPQDEAQRREVVQAFRICGPSRLAAGMFDDLPMPGRSFAAPPTKMPWREYKQARRPAPAVVTKQGSEWSGVWWVVPMIVLFKIFSLFDGGPNRPTSSQSNPTVTYEMFQQLEQAVRESQTRTTLTFANPNLILPAPATSATATAITTTSAVTTKTDALDAAVRAMFGIPPDPPMRPSSRQPSAGATPTRRNSLPPPPRSVVPVAPSATQ